MLDWLGTTHQSAHPDCAFDTELFRTASVYVLCKIWDPPHTHTPGNTPVNHAVLVRWWGDTLLTLMWLKTQHEYGLHPN